jgi:hypothetical protein
MTNRFAELQVNPFEDDVVIEPRRISFSVAGLNDKPLDQLIATFRKLTDGELPRGQIAADKAQLVVSPDRGYGKSHLLGRLFNRLGEQATLIYLRPFQDPQRIWSSILQATIQELERPDQNGTEAGSQLEAFSKGALAHVAADHMADGGVKNYSQIEDAVKYLRAHPLKVLGRAPLSKVLVEWMKSGLDDRVVLQKLAGLLRKRGVYLHGRETAWLRVLAGYAFGDVDGLERDAAVKWLRGDPLEVEELNIIKLVSADNEGKGDSSASEINDLCLQRIKGLCGLSSYYRPFVFCFDQTEFYGNDKDLVTALAKGVDALHASVPNQLTIVTTNATNWAEDVLPLMDSAYRNRFSNEISLEGITENQAKELIKARFENFQINDADVLSFIGEGWLSAQFNGLRQIGVRDLLISAAQRFRALATPSTKPRPRTLLPDLFAIEVNKIRANKALHRYSQDCLMWFAQALADGYKSVAIQRTGGRYFTIRWEWPNRSIYFAFEGGDNNARWRAIAREAVALAGSAEHFGAVVFRTPDLKAIPRPTWDVAKTEITNAQKRGLQIVSLSLDEVCELHAARELYSDARQQNINYDAAEVLQWLKTRFEVWFARYSQSEVVQEDKSKEFKKSKERPLLKGNGKNGGRSARPIEEDLSEAHYERVLTYVSERKLVDINQVLTDLGDQSLKTAVLRAVERTPKIKAHPCPQTIYLQWRLVE